MIVNEMFAGMTDRVFWYGKNPIKSKTVYIAKANLVYIDNMVKVGPDNDWRVIVKDEREERMCDDVCSVVAKYMRRYPLMECWFDQSISIGMPIFEIDGNDVDECEVWWYVAKVYRKVRELGYWMH